MNYIKEPEIKDILKISLKEDTGSKDITSLFLIPKQKKAEAIIITKEDCVVCGLSLVGLIFKLQDKTIKFKPLVKDGQFVKKASVLAKISGRAQSILTAERVALNFLTHLCGISTKTREFTLKIKPLKTKILDTRKTTPGLRLLEKYAVRIGGGFNHRSSLDEMLLIKDNHLQLIGGIEKIKKINCQYKTEIEVKNIAEFKVALKLHPDIIMLDNMKVKDILEAVRIRNNISSKLPFRRPKLEASGGVNLNNIKKIAACGVEMISIGELTHSVKAIDLSLEILP